MFSGFSSVESEFLKRREVWYKAGPCFNFSCDSSIKPKEQPFCFIKKVVPLNFGFDSLGNEQNFLPNQKAGKFMKVTRNKLFTNETTKINYQFLNDKMSTYTIAIVHNKQKQFRRIQTTSLNLYASRYIF